MRLVYVIIGCLLLGLGCASKKYAQDMLPDGKTWMIKAYSIPCEEPAACKSLIKKEIIGRGKRICGEQPFRVITCETKNHNYRTTEAHCLVKCGEKPVTAPGDNKGDALEKDVNL